MSQNKPHERMSARPASQQPDAEPAARPTAPDFRFNTQTSASGVSVVRVKDKTSKHEMTISAAQAASLGDAVEIVDKPAVDSRGALLPAKHHVNLSAPSGGEDDVTSTGRAPTSKEDPK